MISVIIPVFNVEAHLEKCLRSVLSNTYQDLEVICVNDGSTDASPEILHRLRDRDPRIRVIDQENRGLPEARNTGLDVAAGDYIAFIDSDDWVHPRYFESMLRCMESQAADMVVCGCRTFDPGEELTVDPELEPRYRRLTARELYGSCYYARHMIWARLIRRRDAEKLRFPPEVKAMEDTLYNLRLLSSYPHPVVFFTEEPLYFYLQRPGSLVRTQKYWQMTAIADWYGKNGRAPVRGQTGDWGWMLLLQCVSTTLSVRYEARLRKDRETARHCGALLRLLSKDLAREPRIGARKKATRLILSASPPLYRAFRLWDDPTLKEHEQDVRRSREIEAARPSGSVGR